MSRGNDLSHSMCEVEVRLRGSRGTHDARRTTISMFDAIMKAANFQIHHVDQIGGRHLRVFVEAQKAAGHGVRSIQNSLSHIRAILRAAGRKSLADDPNFNNKSLGISGGSRRGTKVPLTEEELAGVRERMNRLKRHGVAAMLELEFTIGLRGAEATSADLNVLRSWERSLLAERPLDVWLGTKGKRRRQTHVVERERALAAVRVAIGIATAQGGFLVIRKNGEEAGGYEQANNIYKGLMSRAGIQAHAARYRFAVIRVNAYLAGGKPLREALQLTALDLGHGSGRSRWLKSVYLACEIDLVMGLAKLVD